MNEHEHEHEHASTAPGNATRVRLDVRPVLARGEEPFTVIMQAVDQLAAGQVLALDTPFDPGPLHKVMAGKGFEHATTGIEDGHFVTEYWRPGAVTPPAGIQIMLDVRGLEPPQPMELTLDALDELPEGGRLVQLNDRVPQFLLPHLEECGFEYAIASDDRGIVVTIWRATA